MLRRLHTEQQGDHTCHLSICNILGIRSPCISRERLSNGVPRIIVVATHFDPIVPPFHPSILAHDTRIELCHAWQRAYEREQESVMNYGNGHCRCEAFRCIAGLLSLHSLLSAVYDWNDSRQRIGCERCDDKRRAHHLAQYRNQSDKQFTTSDEGLYLFAAVPPGAYEMTAEASGFSNEVVKFSASSNNRLTENLVLKIASSNATVLFRPWTRRVFIPRRAD